MNCPKCGAEIGPNTAFCLACGAKVSAAQPAAAAAPASPIQPARPAQSAPSFGAPAGQPQFAQPAAPSPMAGRDPFAPQPAGGTSSYQAPPQPPQQPPQQPRFFDDNLTPIISVGNWLGTLFLLVLVPIALFIVTSIVSGAVGAQHIVTIILSIVASLSGLLMMFIFAFGKGFNPSKRNFFRAALILTLIFIVIFVILFFVASALLGAAFSQLGPDFWQELMDMARYY